MVKSKVKYIQSLSHKKQRDADNVFVAEGPKIINELLNEPAFGVVEIFALPQWRKEHPLLDSIPFTEIDEPLLEKISALSTPNQVVGIFRKPEIAPFDPAGKISLLLNSIQDPGNLGTIIRCADWFGIDQVMCSRDTADVYNSKAVQATMGSISRVKVYYDDLLLVMQNHAQVTTYAATLNGNDVKSIGFIDEGMILIGNESKGISKELLELPHQKVTIARKGRAESLNAAVATGIILHACTR